MISCGLVVVFAYCFYDGYVFRQSIDERARCAAPSPDIRDTLTNCISMCITVYSGYKLIGDLGFGTHDEQQGASVDSSAVTASLQASRSCRVEVSRRSMTTASSTAFGAAASGSELPPPLRVEKTRAQELREPLLSPTCGPVQTESAPPLPPRLGSSAGQPAQSLRVSGWLYKSPSRLGPHLPKSSRDAVTSLEETASRVGSIGGVSGTAGGDGRQRGLSAALIARLPQPGSNISVPQDKRYFVLRGYDLRWFSNEDEATLGMGAKTIVDMQSYFCQQVEGMDHMLALLPATPMAKKSWYLRAPDAESFEAWRGALTAVSAGNELSGSS